MLFLVLSKTDSRGLKQTAKSTLYYWLSEEAQQDKDDKDQIHKSKELGILPS